MAADYQYRTSSVTLPRFLELRTIPTLITAYSNDPTGLNDGVDTAGASVLSNLYGQLKTNWLYSAIIQMSLNGAQPAWSSDGWNFVPVDLSSLDEISNGQAPPDTDGSSNSDVTLTRSTDVLVTIVTPAVRAVLECSPYEALSNVSNWLTAQDFTDYLVWNVAANPAYPTSGYILGCGVNTGYFGSMMLKPNYSSPYPCDAEVSTRFLVQDDTTVQCCDNKTAGKNGDAVLGYWSVNDHGYMERFSENFTVKWIYGNPVAGFQRVNLTYEPYGIWPQNTIMVWPEIPRMAALNCKPVIQKTNASVTVVQQSGRVKSFTILDEPEDDESAWTDYFVEHEPPNAADTGEEDNDTNVTTR